jgi:hypothetical protein
VFKLYRAEVRISDVGAEAWKADVATRQAALDAARVELATVAPPGKASSIGVTTVDGVVTEWKHPRPARIPRRSTTPRYLPA